MSSDSGFIFLHFKDTMTETNFMERKKQMFIKKMMKEMEVPIIVTTLQMQMNNLYASMLAILEIPRIGRAYLDVMYC